MSAGAESNPIAKMKEMLYGAMQEDCRDCIDARMAVCHIVKIIPTTGETELAEDLAGFADYMNMCADGLTEEGNCGTRRKVCQHPQKETMQTDVDKVFACHFEPIVQQIESL